MRGIIYHMQTASLSLSYKCMYRKDYIVLGLYSFAAVSKNLITYRSKNDFVRSSYQNNYVELKLVVRMSKLFAALFIMLEIPLLYIIILIIYVKLFSNPYLTKFLDLFLSSFLFVFFHVR